MKAEAVEKGEFVVCSRYNASRLLALCMCAQGYTSGGLPRSVNFVQCERTGHWMCGTRDPPEFLYCIYWSHGVYELMPAVSTADEAELLHNLRLLACFELTHELLVESQIGPLVSCQPRSLSSSEAVCVACNGIGSTNHTSTASCMLRH